MPDPRIDPRLLTGVQRVFNVGPRAAEIGVRRLLNELAEAGADKIDTRTGSLEHWRVGQDTWNKGRPVLVPPRPGGRRMMRSPRNQLAEAFIRGIEVGAEQPTLAGDGDAMYQAFREWFRLADLDGGDDGE